MEREEKRKTKRPGIPFRLVAGVLLLAVIGLAAGFLWGNRFTLELMPEGDAEIYLEYGEPYQEPGVHLLFSGTKILRGGIIPNAEIQVMSGVDPEKLGKYTVQYNAEFLGYTASFTRTVWVVDSVCPSIELIPYTGQPLTEGKRYQEDGYRATDNYDGDITDRVVRREEEGRILYSVADSSGNPCYAERVLPGYDPMGPKITLEGEARLELPAGVFYEEPGFTAWDNVDGEMTDQVEIEGEVLWYKPGSYPVYYSARDSYGNLSTVVRLVVVTGQPRPETVEPEGKVICLTFDDGPGPYTMHLLDVLDKYNVKATFFVVNSGYDDVLRQIVQRGHSIGIHTMTHAYNDIYANPQAYFQDLLGMRKHILDVTGVDTTLMRFPGGGSNTVSCPNPGIMSLLTEAVQDAGFQYFDWNVDSNDAGGAKTANTVCTNIIEGVRGNRFSVVLQHDIHPYSVEAVEDVIRWGLDNGYTFQPLTPNSPICHHEVRN